VNHVNRPPVFSPITEQVVDENTLLTFVVPAAVDPDKEDIDKIKYTAQELPEGAVFDPADRTLMWTPDYEKSGDYQLLIFCSDDEFDLEQTLNIKVNHVNRPPIIEKINPQTVEEYVQIQITLAAGDPDKEDDGKWILSTAQLPDGAMFDPATANFVWTPDYDQSGEYTITFTNTDPFGLTATQQFLITVNHVNRPPVFNPLPAQTIDENVPLSFTVPEGKDPDKEDIDKIIYSAKNLPAGASFDAASKIFSWTPGFDQSGEYQITIICSDGKFNIEQLSTITVNHINRAPVLNAVSGQVVDENKELVIIPDSNDPDKEDDGRLKFTAQNLPQGAVIDATSGQISWIPTFEQSGIYDNITITVTDPSGLMVEQTFSITVNHVNRPPQIKNIAALSATENTIFTYQIEASDEDEEDAGKLTFSSDNLPVGASLDAASGTLTWTPDFTQAGSYQVNITVTDGGGLTATQPAEIIVQNVNHLPALNPIEDKSVDENSSLTFTISGSDEDTDDDLAYSISDLPDGVNFDEKSGSFSWTPDFTQAGDYNLIVTLSDGEAAVTAAFKIAVNNINRKPTIEKGGSATITVGETAALSFSASDPDDDDLTFSSDNLPEGASLNTSGDFNWTPDENQVGTFVFTVEVTDGTDTAQTSASITVKSVPPPEPQQN
ncbi:MAG: putative Ig domain-containing protein, partial [Calditrichia bacterium]